MKRGLTSFLLLMVCVPHCFALQAIGVSRPIQILSADQSHEVFDVVAIHRSRPDQTGFSIHPDADDFAVSNSSLAYLVQLAYDVLPSQILGMPANLNSMRFDVLAKTEPTKTADGEKKTSREARQALLRLRLQAMLKDRFHLEVQRTIKKMPGLVIKVSPGGPKLTPASDMTKGYSTTWGHLSCGNTTMDTLAAILSTQLQTLVQNKTDLSGGFSFELKWETQDRSEMDEQFPSLRSAMKEQLGLAMTPAVEPINVLVITKAEVPSVN